MLLQYNRSRYKTWFSIMKRFENACVFLVDDELYYTSGGVRKKVVLTVQEIGEILHHHHSNVMGGHSGVNATLNKISNFYCWNVVTKTRNDLKRSKTT